MINKIFIVASLCFIMCLLLILALEDKHYTKIHDPYEYAQIGQNLWAGHGIRYNGIPDVVLSPGMPFVSGGINLILNSPEWSVKFVSIISFILSLFLIYKNTLFFLDEKKFGWMVVFLFSTNSNVLANAASGYSESLFTLVFLTMVWLRMKLLNVTKPVIGIISIFAVLWAWLYYIRPEGLIIGGILFLWLVFDSFSARRSLLMIPIVYVILIFPYVFFLEGYTGNRQLSGKTYLNLVMGELDSPYQSEKVVSSSLERYTIVERTLIDPTLSFGFTKYLSESQNDIIRRIPTNFIKTGKIYWFTFSALGLMLALWGLLGLNQRSIFFLISLLIPILVYLIFFILIRTIAMYHWIWILCITNGLRNLGSLIESRVNPRLASYAIYIGAILIMVYQIRSSFKIAWDIIFV